MELDIIDETLSCDEPDNENQGSLMSTEGSGVDEERMEIQQEENMGEGEEGEETSEDDDDSPSMSQLPELEKELCEARRIHAERDENKAHPLRGQDEEEEERTRCRQLQEDGGGGGGEGSGTEQQQGEGEKFF